MAKIAITLAVVVSGAAISCAAPLQALPDDPASAPVAARGEIANPLNHIAPGSSVVVRGTPVKLMILNEVTTKTAKAGDKFVVILDRPIIIDNRVVVPSGLRGLGEVTLVKGNGGLGTSGKLTTHLLYLDFAGNHISITGETRSAGNGGTDQVVLASLALTPWGLFARGNNAKLKAGDIVDAAVAEDFTVPPVVGATSQP